MSEDSTLTREMGCTEADFMRWLPGATRHAPLESNKLPDGWLHRVAIDGGAVEIRLKQLAPRRLGRFTLPVLEARFRFLGLSTPQREAFLAWFDHYTRRGGG